MKTYLTKAMALAIIACTAFNCTVEPIDSPLENIDTTPVEASQLDVCDSEDPVARLTNNGTVHFDIYVYSMIDGSLLASEVNVAPGTTTNWLGFSTGEVLFSLENDNFSEYKVVHTMDTCTQLELEIASDNSLVASVPQQL